MPTRVTAPVPSPAAPPPEGRARNGAGGDRAALALVVLVPLALYARTLGYGWLEVSDAEVRAATSLAAAFGRGGIGGALLYLEGTRGSALVARVVTLLLFAAASALVLALGRRLGLGRGQSLFLALLFAVHPLASEGVAWLAQRGPLLATVFLLLGAVTLLGEPRGRPRIVLGALALLTGLACEPRFVPFVPWVVLAVRWTSPAPRAGLAIDLALLAAGVLGWVDPFEPLRAVDAPAAIAGVLALWSWPVALTPTHGGFSCARLPLVAGALPWLIVLLAGSFLLRVRPRAPRLALGGLLFLLVAGTGPSPLGTFREATASLAGLGLALAVVSVAPARAATCLAGGALLLAAAGRTWVRLGDWRSEPRLQEAALAVRPHDAHAFAALGQWHLAHGRLSEAERVLLRALPPYDVGIHSRALMHLGEIELRRGLLPGQGAHLVAARESLEASTATSLAPARAHARLGEVHQRLGDLEAARSTLERAVTLDPHDAEPFTRLGMVQRDLGALDEARAAFERALDLDPRSAEAWCGLGLLLAQQESPAAEAALRRALALEPDQPESNAALGRFQELRGERAAAEASYRAAVGVNPDYVDGLFALGAFLAESAPEEALRALERVVALRPPPRPHVRAYLACARLYLARGEREVPRRLLAAVLAFNPAQGEARALLAELEQGPR